MTFEQALERYPGEWVLIEITEREEERTPSRGRVVAHDASYDRMRELRDGLDPPPSGSKGYYLYEAVPFITTGEGLRRALAEAGRIGIADAWGRW